MCVNRVWRLDVDDDAEPMTQVFQADQPAEWAFADFAHAGLDAEILRDQLRVALAACRGVRVVVRGPEGSGRRSLVRAVAAELGAVTWRLRAGEDALSPDDLARLAVVSVAREGGVVLLVEPTAGGMRSMFQRAYFPGRRRPRPEPVEEADTDVRPDVPLVFIVDQSDDEDDESPFSMPTETPRADVVVHATSATLLGDDDRATRLFLAQLPLEALRPGTLITDLVYTPRDTALLRAARAHGARALDGTAMLLHQGALAFERWTGLPAPLEAMRAALDAPFSVG